MTTTRGSAPLDRGPHGHGEAASADIDLAVRWLGGSVIAASDEAFGDKENLLRPEPAAFEPGHYGNRGEIVDGWETRRRRTPGRDWATVRLGAAGTVSSIDVDTSFFTGNYPVSCRVDATGRQGYPSPAELDGPETTWEEIVPRSPLRGDAHNVFPVTSGHRFTHVRLWIDPDGGVARLRVLGRVVPDPRLLDLVSVDLAGHAIGGRVMSSSDGFYTSASSLIRPDRARTMGEGWETRRRRDDGHDFAIIGLGVPGTVRHVIVDTSHFKYNASEAVAIYATPAAGGKVAAPSFDSQGWQTLVPRARLQPDTRHAFDVRGAGIAVGPVTAVRLDAFPDGGIARVRVVGEVSREGRLAAALTWFNALTTAEALEVLAAEAAAPDPRVAQAVAAARPLARGWREQLERLTVPDRNGGALTTRVAELLEGRFA